jgi:hypothetical protein
MGVMKEMLCGFLLMVWLMPAGQLSAQATSGEKFLLISDGGVGAAKGSLPAIERAVEQGYDMIVLPVRASYDGEPFVYAFDTMQPVGETGRIQDHASNNVRLYAYTGTEETIQTLEQMLGAINGRVPVMLHLQGGKHTPEFFQNILDAVEATKQMDKVRAYPRVVAADAVWQGRLKWGYDASAGVSATDPQKDMVIVGPQEVARTEAAAGVPVIVRLSGTKTTGARLQQQVRDLQAKGVSGVIVDAAQGSELRTLLAK